jgi:regulator of cell morphogenesis and NO signaling
MHDTDVISDLTVRRPLALGVLYAHGLDARSATCTLDVACRQRGLEPSAVLDEIARAERAITAPWETRSLTDVVEHVRRRYHREFAAAKHMLAVPRPRCDPELWGELHQLLVELRTDMEHHMAKEENVLFPWLCTRPTTAVVPIRAMQLEHADTIALLHAVHTALARALPAGRDADSDEASRRLAHVELTLCEHMHLENNELFPRALESSSTR